MYNRCAHVHCIKFIAGIERNLKNFIFFLLMWQTPASFYKGMWLNRKESLLCMYLSACIFIAELLFDTCFIPLYMNNLYIYQIYILILSEPSNSHKTVQTYIWFLEMPNFNIATFYKWIFMTGKSVLPLSNVTGVHGRQDCSAVHFRGVSKTVQ